MQKRGFPAAGLLAILILTALLSGLVITFIFQQLDPLDRSRNNSLRRSATSHRARQAL